MSEPYSVEPAPDGQPPVRPGWPGTRGAPAEFDVRVDADGRLADDVPCRGCGYNLRGQRLYGRCSECGMSVPRSVRGDDLKYSEPDWVKKLLVGTNWLIAGVLGSIVLGFISAPVSEDSVASAVVAFIGIGLSFVSLVGYWLVTTPDPGMVDEPSLSPRRVVRVCMVASFFGAPLSFAAILAEGTTTYVVLEGLALFLGILGLIGYIALFIHGRRLARRIPDERLVRQTTIVMWGTVSSIGLMLLALVFVLFLTAGTAPTSGIALVGVGACAGMLGVLVFGIWGIVLLFFYQKGFKHAMDEAYRTWASDIRRYDPPQVY